MVARPEFRHGQIHLGHVAGDDHFGVESQSGQEHLHLLFGGVLGLVEDHERVVERAAAHVGERRHFDGAVVHVSFELVRSEHVGQRVVQRSQVRVDLFVERARQEAEVLPASTAGRVSMMRRTCLSWKRTYRFGYGKIGFGRCLPVRWRR